MCCPPLSQDVDAAIAAANAPSAHERLKAQTDAARGYGIFFGSPAFVVDGETFWGIDRLEEAFAWADGRHRLQKAVKSGLRSSSASGTCSLS
ncbi:DsbA family protein [Mesorhizobium shangrilense]|uniref:DsbA family protein n=1 Tax=Mesorhizobium shangrilense TaxID=460060 RepID=A0ABV2DS95_9HYPH